MKISVDKIVRVFLTENHNSLTDEDSEKLSHYNLLDIYNYIVNENVSDEEKRVAELFNFYYSGNTDKNEG